MEFKKLIEEQDRLECLKTREELTDYGLEMLTELNQALLLLQPDVSSSVDNKGELNGKCNITSCQKPKSATWYNHSTRKHYCPSCARRLNNDELNKRDAMRMFGHDLCTEVL